MERCLTDYDLERRYLIDERLGMMCGANEPTHEQRRLAEAYSESEINRLMRSNKVLDTTQNQ